MLKETSFYRSKGEALTCLLCPHRCTILEGRRGRCGVREHRGGSLYERTYPYVSALSLDPIEKKPLYHFYPGTSILSLGMRGCNLACSFCQNWRLSQNQTGEGKELKPLELVEMASRESSIGLAFTYSEPLIFFEYVKEAAILAEKRGLKVVLVSNGYCEEEPLKELTPYIHAFNLDIKAYSPSFYEEYCRGSLDPVLGTAEILVKAGVHLEITNLIIPTLNDRDEDLKALFSFIRDLKEDIPLHLTRYFPNYRMRIHKTPKETLERALSMAKEMLPFVYIGNLLQGDYQKTICPDCGHTLIHRFPYLKLDTDKGQCPCGYQLPIPGLTNN